MADGQKPEELLDVQVASLDVVQQRPVVELEAGLEHRVGREVDLATDLVEGLSKSLNYCLKSILWLGEGLAI